jgi:hypothetical protein
LTSPLALRGLRRALRVTPRSTTSRSAAVNSRVSSGLMSQLRSPRHRNPVPPSGDRSSRDLIEI